MVKNPPANAGGIGDMGLITGSGRFSGERHSNPLQYSCLKNPHGQRNLVGYILSVGSQRVGHDWATKHTHRFLESDESRQENL